MNGFDGWTCTIFHRKVPSQARLASELILAAECVLAADYKCGPDGMMTYVWEAMVRSDNPGYCFKAAGWRRVGQSVDGRKALFHKPFSRAGL